MRSLYPASVYRRIEKAVLERIMRLRKRHDQFLVATGRALPHELDNDGLIPVQTRTAGPRPDQLRPRD